MNDACAVGCDLTSFRLGELYSVGEDRPRPLYPPAPQQADIALTEDAVNHLALIGVLRSMRMNQGARVVCALDRAPHELLAARQYESWRESIVDPAILAPTPRPAEPLALTKARPRRLTKPTWHTFSAIHHGLAA